MVEMKCEVDGVWIVECIWDGFEVVIVGVLNVGKLMFFNWFVGWDVVIILDIVGIMCDVIEVWMDFGGLFVMMLDIVGLCEIDDVVEGLGIEWVI